MHRIRKRAALACGALLIALGVSVPLTTQATALQPMTTFTGTLTSRTNASGATVFRLQAGAVSIALQLPEPPAITVNDRRALRQKLLSYVNQYVVVTVRPHLDGTDTVWDVAPAQPPPPLVMGPPPVPPTDVPPPTPADVPAPAPVYKRVAFVVVHWSNASTAGVADVNTVQSWAFTSPTSVAAYYLASTNNMIHISGDVIPATLPPGSDTATDCVPFSASVSGGPAVLGARLASYDYVVYVAQDLGSSVPCQRRGVAGGTSAVVAGMGMQGQDWFVLWTVHEMGHLLGLGHAGMTACPGATPTISCFPSNTDQYGDQFDPMGSSWPPRQFNAVHKMFLGALPAGAVQTAAVGIKSYWIYASDAPGDGGVRLLQIPRGTTGQMYELEIRALNVPWGTTNLAAPEVNGVSVQLINANHSPLVLSTYVDTSLIDMTPLDHSTTYAQLTPGQGYGDAAAGVAFVVRYAHNGWAKVDVLRTS